MPQQKQMEFDLQDLLVLVDLLHLYTDGIVDGKSSPVLAADELDSEELSLGGDDINRDETDQEEDESLQDEAGTTSNRCGPLFTDGREKLKSRFLDRFAEFASKEKGAFSVTCSAMEEQEDEVVLWLSANEGLKKKTEEDLRAFGGRLQAVRDASNEGAEEALWSLMLDFNVSRITETYIPSFCKRLKEYNSRAEQLTASSLTQDELNSVKGLQELQKLSTRPSQGICAVGSGADSPVVAAYGLRHDEALKEVLLDAGQNSAYGRRLWTSILFLGRLRAAFHTFKTVARLLPCFGKVSVMFVPRADVTSTTLSGTPLTFDQAMALLTVEARSSLCSRLRQKMPEAKAAARFTELQRLTRHVHAEIQMIWHLEARGSNGSSVTYLGCSKYSCFMCWNFIQAHGKYRTRGCHGQLHTRWMLPSSGNLDGRHQKQCWLAVGKVFDHIMERLVVKRCLPVQPAPESSAGLTRSIDKVSLRDAEKSTLAEKYLAEQKRQVPDKGLFDDFIAAVDKDDQQPAELDRFGLWAPKRRCTMCNKAKSKLCTKCRSSAYCSTRCQTTDWPLHKLLCKNLRPMLRTRPSATFKLGLLFPMNTKVPSLVWVDCELHRDEEDNVPYEVALVEHLLGEDRPITDRRLISRSVRRNFNLDHTVTVYFRDAFLKDGSRANQSIASVGGAVPGEWKGPAVVMRHPDAPRQFLSSSDLRFYEDITLVDLRVAVDYFRTYNDGTVDDLEFYRQPLDDIVKGVKITCVGDQKNFGMDQYVAVAVSKRDLIFQFGDSKPAIPQMVGFPITIRRYPPDQRWKDEPIADHDGGDPYTNRVVTFLHQDTVPTRPRWGWAPMEWQNDVGSVIVVRSDGPRDVDPRQVEALCQFCLEMQPFFEDSIGAGLVERTKEEVLRMLTPANFRAFFEKFRAERAGEDGSWMEVECPVAG